MAAQRIERARILGTGRALPAHVRTNLDLEKMVDTSDQWITERTGIKERRILEAGRVTSDLAAEAGRAACEAAGILPSALDCIIVGTVTPDMPMPAAAVYVQQKLGASCAAFDLSAACAGFVYGLSIADSFVKTRQFRHVLVIGVEVLSRIIDWTDRNTCILFGDGAGAVVVGPSADESGILSTHLFADGSYAPALCIPAGGSAEPITPDVLAQHRQLVHMNGKAIFSQAVKNLSNAARAALAANELTSEQIDVVVAHQANLRIVEAVAERLAIPIAKFFLNIEKYGNTSSASIPIALDEAVRQGRVKRGDTLLFTALGAGLSWGSAIVRY